MYNKRDALLSALFNLSQVISGHTAPPSRAGNFFHAGARKLDVVVFLVEEQGRKGLEYVLRPDYACAANSLVFFSFLSYNGG